MDDKDHIMTSAKESILPSSHGTSSSSSLGSHRMFTQGFVMPTIVLPTIVAVAKNSMFGDGSRKLSLQVVAIGDPAQRVSFIEGILGQRTQIYTVSYKKFQTEYADYMVRELTTSECYRELIPRHFGRPHIVLLFCQSDVHNLVSYIPAEEKNSFDFYTVHFDDDNRQFYYTPVDINHLTNSVIGDLQINFIPKQKQDATVFLDSICENHYVATATAIEEQQEESRGVFNCSR